MLYLQLIASFPGLLSFSFAVTILEAGKKELVKREEGLVKLMSHAFWGKWVATMVIDHTPTHFWPKACSTCTGALPRHLAPGNSDLECSDAWKVSAMANILRWKWWSPAAGIR